jgi:hypothetical protein
MDLNPWSPLRNNRKLRAGAANAPVKRHRRRYKSRNFPRYHWIDPAQQMARRNAPFEIEKVKQLALIALPPTHHG